MSDNWHSCNEWIGGLHLVNHSCKPSTCKLGAVLYPLQDYPPDITPLEDTQSELYEGGPFGIEWTFTSSEPWCSSTAPLQALARSTMTGSSSNRDQSPSKRMREVSGLYEPAKKRSAQEVRPTTPDRNHFDDLDATPKASHGASATSAFSIHSLTILSPKKVLTTSRKSSPTRSTGTSTNVEDLNQLRSMDPPITFQLQYGVQDMFEDERLSKEVQGLMEDIRKLCKQNEIIPNTIKDDPLFKYTLDGKFGRASVPSNRHRLDDVWEFKTILCIVDDSRRMDTDNQIEAAWNSFVHSNILTLATRLRDEIRCENITLAQIKDELAPVGAANDSIKAKTISKMVDFAFVIRPHVGSPMANAIDALLSAQPGNLQTINQSGAECLTHYPAAVHIETKRTKAHTCGKVQLGVWISALYKRFYTLFGSDVAIPSIPLLIATGKHWEIMMACQDGKGAVVLGPVEIGHTSAVEDCYMLLAILRVLVEWANTTFRDWIMGQINRVQGRST